MKLVSGKIGLGCVTFGREVDEQTSYRLLDYAFQRGVRLLDTAEAYGAGQSERIVGSWLHQTGVRSEVILQTKISFNYTPEGVRAAIANSLSRLRTDYIDWYLFHKLDESVPLVNCLREIQRTSEVRNVGCSNVSSAMLAASLDMSHREGLPKFSVVQPPYNLVQRSIERDLIPLCRKENIAVIPYSPLAAGFLTGKYSANRSAVPPGSRFHTIPGHMDVYFHEHNFAVVSALQNFAARVGAPAEMLALAWVLQNPDIPAVLVGARTTAHLDNAFEAAEMRLPGDWLNEMNSWQAG